MLQKYQLKAASYSDALYQARDEGSCTFGGSYTFNGSYKSSGQGCFDTVQIARKPFKDECHNKVVMNGEDL